MVYFIDPYYAVLNLCICFVWQMGFYFVAAALKIDKVTDFAYGTNFAVLSIVTFFLNGSYFYRQIVVNILVLLGDSNHCVPVHSHPQNRRGQTIR